jgi:hypothetical protein
MPNLDWIWIREGEKDPQIQKNKEKKSGLKAGFFFLRAGGLSRSLKSFLEVSEEIFYNFFYK